METATSPPAQVASPAKGAQMESTYRNFFQPATRWQFTGMCLAT